MNPPQEPVRGLPMFPGGGVPRPESRERKLYIRAVAVFALALTVAYLSWRAVFTIDLDAWWVSLPLFAFEFYAFVSLGLFAFTLWDIDVRAEFSEATVQVFPFLRSLVHLADLEPGEHGLLDHGRVVLDEVNDPTSEVAGLDSAVDVVDDQRRRP